MSKPRRSAAALLASCMAAFLLAGCTLGLKSWPEPRDQADTFGWHSVNARLEGRCLMVEARLDGDYRNFESAYLHIQPLGPDACAGCPFNTARSLEFRRGAPGFEMVGPWMQMRVCDVDTSIPHRIRIQGINRLAALPDITSQVVRTDP